VATVGAALNSWPASGSKTFGLRDKPARNLWPGEDVMSNTH